MKKQSTTIEIVYPISFVIFIIQALLILGSKFVGNSEFFDFNYKDQVNLVLHFLLLAVNAIYLVVRRNEPEKWMTIINSVVGLFSINIARDFFALLFLYTHLKNLI